MALASRFALPAYLVSLLVAAALLAAFWYWQGRPVILPEVASATHKLQCVSYSPFDKDQSPLVESFVIRPERLDADLALLSRYFSCVRTYSMTGMEQLPDIARKHGLKVMLGAWVGRDLINTRAELDLLVEAANRHPDVVQSVIVGNEALLRKDISGARLAELIADVKSRVSQPVTYADVWEFWLKHPQVAPEVDFITIHLLPYWEDEPSGIDTALAHVGAVREEYGRLFAPKEILIGETGWPSEGRQRETALPSRINQAKFIRGFVAMAENNGWSYNLIEAFDQPWKRANEGAVGGYWGLFDADRQDKQVLSGPVSDLPQWRHWLLVSVLIAVAGLVLAGVPRSAGGAIFRPPLIVLGAVCMALWWQQGVNDNRNGWEWLWTGALALLNALVLARAVLIDAVRGRRARWGLWLQRHAGTLLLCSGFVGAVLMMQLVFDPRYRQFPSYVLLIPALCFLRWPAVAGRRELMLLLVVIALGIPFQLWEETLVNQQALSWASAATLLALALWRSLHLSRAAPGALAGTSI